MQLFTSQTCRSAFVEVLRLLAGTDDCLSTRSLYWSLWLPQWFPPHPPPQSVFFILCFGMLLWVLDSHIPSSLLGCLPLYYYCSSVSALNSDVSWIWVWVLHTLFFFPQITYLAVKHLSSTLTHEFKDYSALVSVTCSRFLVDYLLVLYFLPCLWDLLASHCFRTNICQDLQKRPLDSLTTLLSSFLRSPEQIFLYHVAGLRTQVSIQWYW